MKISTIIKSSVCVLGLVGVGNFFAAPANAQAVARGAVTVVRPSGSSLSISGELVAAEGVDITGTLAINVVGGANPGANDETFTGISIVPGAFVASVAAAAGTNPIEAAIALQLVAATAIEDQAALVRAVYANGFGGME